jgi:hypothetical protein
MLGISQVKQELCILFSLYPGILPILYLTQTHLRLTQSLTLPITCRYIGLIAVTESLVTTAFFKLKFIRVMATMCYTFGNCHLLKYDAVQ